MIFLIPLLVLTGSPALADPRVFPSFDEPALQEPEAPARAAKAIPREISVLVFPHQRTYVIPQGREKDPSEVTLEFSKPCGEFEGKVRFAAETLSAPVRIECPDKAETTVQREEGIKSYRYAGSFTVRPGKTPEGRRTVEVLNRVDLETYLRGVVPSEVLFSWPDETLKAQAIAARTYALYELQASPSGEIDDTVQYQAYLGVSQGNPRTDRAVEATRGQVVIHDGSVIKAYFSADSGGFTEASENVWGDALPYCRSKREVYPEDAVNTAWKRVLSTQTINEKLLSRKLIPEGSEVQELSVIDAERFASGRANRIWLTLRDGATLPLKAFDFRLALGLRSTWFEVRKDPEGAGLLFLGRGFGHGVGLSQEGARALAETLGWNAQRILEFYYEGARVEELSQSEAGALP